MSSEDHQIKSEPALGPTPESTTTGSTSSRMLSLVDGAYAEIGPSVWMEESAYSSPSPTIDPEDGLLLSLLTSGLALDVHVLVHLAPMIMRKGHRADETIATFNVAVIGDYGVGKTTFLMNHVGFDFTTTQRTRAKAVASIFCHTSKGSVLFHCCDTGGQERFGGLRDTFYIGLQAAIIIFDLSSRTSLKNVNNWYRDINRVCGDIPTCILGNKLDLVNKLPPMMIFRRLLRKGARYDVMSNLGDFNTHAPFELLARDLLKDPCLRVYPSFPPRSLLAWTPEQIEMAEKTRAIHMQTD